MSGMATCEFKIFSKEAQGKVCYMMMLSLPETQTNRPRETASQYSWRRNVNPKVGLYRGYRDNAKENGDYYYRV